MANNGKTSGEMVKQIIELTGAVVTVVAATSSLPGVKEGINSAVQSRDRKAEEKQALVEVPKTYSSDFRLTLEEATRWLEEDGLRVKAVAVEPDITFREYPAMAVVSTSPKPRQRVKAGTRVFVKYVSPETIEASQRLFDDRELQRATAKQKKIDDRAEKTKKRAEQNAKARQKLGDTVSTVQRSVNRVAANVQKGIGEHLPKKRDVKDIKPE